MPTYHFTLRKCPPLDYRGLPREYPDLDTALADAQRAAREVVGQHLRSDGLRVDQASLDIEDERHRPVARIMLAELVRRAS
jgi:hypothetical protein